MYVYVSTIFFTVHSSFLFCHSTTERMIHCFAYHNWSTNIFPIVMESQVYWKLFTKICSLQIDTYAMCWTAGSSLADWISKWFIGKAIPPKVERLWKNSYDVWEYKRLTIKEEERSTILHEWAVSRVVNEPLCCLDQWSGNEYIYGMAGHRMPVVRLGPCRMYILGDN